MVQIEISNIEKKFGDTLILDKVNLTIYPKQINVIIGPSGCGKSTMLHIIAGFDRNIKGYVKGIESDKMSYVFQEDRLLGWKSIEKNILYSLSGRVDKQLLLEYSNALGLSEYMNHYPDQLSGGLRQRVNLIRAFLYPSSLLLMDEPFKSLDIQTKEEAVRLFLRVQKKKEATVILVTHSLEEALQLGNYIHVLSNKPTRLIETFKNPYSSLEKRYSIEDRELFLNKIKEMVQ